MRDRPSGHRIQVDLNVDAQPVDDRPLTDEPFCVALLGDFSGRGHRDGVARGPGSLAIRESVLVDRDNLDEVCARLRPEVRVPLPDEAAVRIAFASVEDFHPDRLYDRASVFDGVRELRRQLADPAAPSSPPPPPPEQARTELAPPGGGSLLDQIVQQSASERAGPPPARSPLEGGDLQAYLNHIVAPHVERTDPQRQALLAKVDGAVAAGLRALIHHADFQALEALWRGLRLLVHAVESDVDVRIYLFDVTKEELADAPSSELLRLLSQPPAAAPTRGWGALGGCYSFTPDGPDLELLAQLGSVAGQVGAPWISAADPRIAGCDAIGTSPDPSDWVPTPDPAWQDLRRTPGARWIGLAMPRFLLRLPYGERGSRCDVLAFEELSDTATQAEYLWGNPTFACLVLLVQETHPGMSLEIAGLPVYVAAPAAEAILGERAVERILDRGLMPLIAIRDSDRVRLLRFQAIADPPAPLGGL
jgi:type VI secretion system protein ImpC